MKETDRAKIEYAKKAVKYIEYLDKPTKQRIKASIIGLTENPPKGDIIKKLVVAWDPDYTKVTPSERKELEDAERDMIENGTVSHEAINWD